MCSQSLYSEGQASLQADPLFDEAFLRRLERLSLLSRRAMAGQWQGERRSPKRGQSVEFADFRPYVLGDDFRHIDWNAYARLERLFVKLFVEEQDLTIHLLVDASRSMDWGEPSKLWYSLRAAGALGYIALSGLDRVTVGMLSDGTAGAQERFPPRRGKQQAAALFSFLAAQRPGGQVDLQDRLRTYAGGSARPGPAVLLSDLLDEGWEDGLRALSDHGFEASVLHILSADEISPEMAGDLRLVDVETGSETEITADREALHRYREALKAWRDQVRRFCGARGFHYVPVDTSIPFEELLFAVLRHRRVVG